MPSASPPRQGTGWRWCARLLVAGWLAGGGWLVALAGSANVPDAVAGPVMLAFTAVACVAAVRAACHRWPQPRTRRAGVFMAAGFVALLASDVLFAVSSGFPGPGDVLRLAAVPFLLVALLEMPHESRSPVERRRLALDIGIVVSVGFMVLWYWSLGPLLSQTGVAVTTLIVAGAYPLADLVLVLGAATALMRGVPDAVRRPVVLVVAGLATLVVADVSNVAVGVRGSSGSSAPALQWLGLLTAFFLLASAAVDQCRWMGGERPHGARERSATAVSMLPYVAVAAGYGLLMVAAVAAGRYPWGGLIAGALVMTACVVARQVLVLRENHQLVITDQLTGVASRSQLHADLSDALVAAARSGGTTAVLLIDLDGFKELNDEYGHEAGDQMLKAFAGLLRPGVSRPDTVGRIGGDEFVVVLPDVASAAAAGSVADRLLHAMETPCQ